MLGPPVCQLCGGRGVGPDICVGCYRDLPRNRQACPVCAVPVASPGPCSRCLLEPPLYDRSHAPFLYVFPIDRMLQRLKYGRYLPHARLLGEMTGHLLRPLEDRPEAIVPVPLHRRRLRSRGFNQAREIGAAVARVTGIALRDDVCRRVRDTRPLWVLNPGQRRRELRDAFECPRPPPAHVALLDDVLTTGSTADAAARTLRRNGARMVQVWSVARSPRRPHGPQVPRKV